MSDRFTHGFYGSRHEGKRMGALWNNESGLDGDITLSVDFDSISYVERLTLLEDWIFLLSKEHEILHLKVYGDDKE